MTKILKYLLFLLLLFIGAVLIANLLYPAMRQKPEDSTSAPRSTYESDSISNERILCIDDNEEALLWRLRMIANAKESIILSTFDLRSDESGTDILAALYHAAERGIKIRLLLDGIYEPFYLKNSEPFHAFCAHENVEVRFYNRINLKNIFKANYRMHDKYLIIDDQMYLLGGRNTNDIFLGSYSNSINIDRDILVYETEPGKGSSYMALQKYFYEIWDSSYVENADYKIDVSQQEKQFSIFCERYEQLQKRYENFSEYDNWQESTIETNKITLLTNGIHTNHKAPQLLNSIKQLASEGTDVVIQTPYVICDSYMYEVLETIEKQAELKIILNAVERGSNPWGCSDYLNNQAKILSTGTDVYELMNEHAVHTKTILIDNNLSIVGSYNLDMRSTYLDTELMLVIDCEELNTYLRQMNEIYIQKSLAVRSDGTETVGPLYRPILLSNSKRFFYNVLRIVIRPFRYLL